MKNIKQIGLVLFVLASFSSKAQSAYEKEIENHQETLNEEFRNLDESPLNSKDFKKFKNHKFFPINESYKVEAKFIKKEKPLFYQMKTSTARIADYDVYGIAEFEMNGQKFSMNIYQSHRLRKMEEYKDDLFLPFTDLTNGEETYGGGRYMDLSIPTGDTIVIDFNKAYNPYCAYSYKYSCPIPPIENDMNIRVEAGIKNLKKGK